MEYLLSFKHQELLKIPSSLNLLISIFVFLGLFLLFLAINQAQTLSSISIYTLLFSALFITNYSMVHEAGHNKAHSSPKINYFIGFLGSLFFFTSFTHCKEAHWNHHLRNRSNKECFDLITPSDNSFFKTFSWYIYLLGLWFILYPVGSALMLLIPGATLKLYNRLNSKVGNFQEGDKTTYITNIARIELILIILFHLTIIFTFSISLFTYFLCYTLGTAWWCTIQYVEHAYAPNKIIEGSWNLKTSKWFGLLSLHRSHDLNHHKYPRVSWYHLPKVDPIVTQEKQSILRQYFKMWRIGPIKVDSTPIDPWTNYEADYSKLKQLKYIPQNS